MLAALKSCAVRSAPFEKKRAVIAAFYRLLAPIDGVPFAESFFQKHPCEDPDLAVMLRVPTTFGASKFSSQLHLGFDPAEGTTWLKAADEHHYLTFLLDSLATDFKASPWQPLVHSIITLIDYSVRNHFKVWHLLKAPVRFDGHSSGQGKQEMLVCTLLGHIRALHPSLLNPGPGPSPPNESTLSLAARHATFLGHCVGRYDKAWLGPVIYPLTCESLLKPLVAHQPAGCRPVVQLALSHCGIHFEAVERGRTEEGFLFEGFVAPLMRAAQSLCGSEAHRGSEAVAAHYAALLRLMVDITGQPPTGRYLSWLLALWDCSASKEQPPAGGPPRPEPPVEAAALHLLWRGAQATHPAMRRLATGLALQLVINIDLVTPLPLCPAPHVSAYLHLPIPGRPFGAFLTRVAPAILGPATGPAGPLPPGATAHGRALGLDSPFPDELYIRDVCARNVYLPRLNLSFPSLTDMLARNLALAKAAFATDLWVTVRESLTAQTGRAPRNVRQVIRFGVAGYEQPDRPSSRGASSGPPRAICNLQLEGGPLLWTSPQTGHLSSPGKVVVLCHVAPAPPPGDGGRPGPALVTRLHCAALSAGREPIQVAGGLAGTMSPHTLLVIDDDGPAGERASPPATGSGSPDGGDDEEEDTPVREATLSANPEQGHWARVMLDPSLVACLPAPGAAAGPGRADREAEGLPYNRLVMLDPGLNAYTAQLGSLMAMLVAAQARQTAIDQLRCGGASSAASSGGRPGSSVPAPPPACPVAEWLEPFLTGHASPEAMGRMQSGRPAGTASRGPAPALAAPAGRVFLDGAMGPAGPLALLRALRVRAPAAGRETVLGPCRLAAESGSFEDECVLTWPSEQPGGGGTPPPAVSLSFGPPPPGHPLPPLPVGSSQPPSPRPAETGTGTTGADEGESRPTGSLPFGLTEAQQCGLLSALLGRLTLIVGPPGTGKTDLLAAIIRLLALNFAPANPAPKVLVVTDSNAALDQLAAMLVAPPAPIRPVFVLRLGGQSTCALAEGCTADAIALRRRHEHDALLAKLGALVGWPAGPSAEPGADGGPAAAPGSERLPADEATALVTKFLAAQADRRRGDVRPPGQPWTGATHWWPTWSVSCLRGAERDEALLAEAPVVLATCSGAAIRGDFIRGGRGGRAPIVWGAAICEEAGKIFESSLLPVLGLRPERVLMVGDERQLAPLVRDVGLRQATALDQPLFKRLQRLGCGPSRWTFRGAPALRPAPPRHLPAPAPAPICDLYRWRYPCLRDLLPQPQWAGALSGLVVGPSPPAEVAAPAGRAAQLLRGAPLRWTRTGAVWVDLCPAPNQGGGGRWGGVDCGRETNAQQQPWAPLGPAKITILSPYRAQVALIQHLLDLMAARLASPWAALRPREVATTDQFQGSQNNVVLLSLVQTGPMPSPHMRDERRITVATSRARSFLAILGRWATFSACPEWKAVQDHLQAPGGPLVVQPEGRPAIFLAFALFSSVLSAPLVAWSHSQNVFSEYNSKEIHETITADHLKQILALTMQRTQSASDRTPLFFFLEEQMRIQSFLESDSSISLVKEIFNAAPSAVAFPFIEESPRSFVELLRDSVSPLPAMSLVCVHAESPLCKEAASKLGLIPQSFDDMTVEDGSIVIVCMSRHMEDHGAMISRLSQQYPTMTAVYASNKLQAPAAPRVKATRPRSSNGLTPDTHYFPSSILQGVLFMIIFAGALLFFLWITISLQTPANFDGDAAPGQKQK
ncbi:putative ATP-dependent RNA helicase of the SFI superfamily [Paratrimastix pyriformis]|uniref:ATP-dependent RNA helicase of the SFI superfamily n=1 Tax=Paratrimastix pyriformis TaxID=342808 RepID=A0ABQ8ULL2_9EUKA|nr:putative ATP-dependent RNA helicase of the SFI superfamily [Paratrimastix pyriformis]